MKLGLIVRANNRGLGIQTWEIYRYLRPAVTVLIDSIPDHGKWKSYPERFPDAISTEWAGYTAPISKEAKAALLDCDLIFTVETPYDPDLFTEAKAMGVATVIYVNPELHRQQETQDATQVWVPTLWRFGDIPNAVHVTMPVALDRLPYNPGERFLHLGGHKARSDRNGMETAIRAARLAGIEMTVTSQDQGLRFVGRGIIHGPTLDNYWEMYSGFGVLVMPRKYGGLCLPVQEALASGLAVIMSDTEPNQHWPVSLVPVQKGQRIRMVGGDIQLWETFRQHLAEEMQRMQDSEYRRVFQERGRAWAEANSWDALLPEWETRLGALI